MDRERQTQERKPFQDTVDTGFFFPGGGRGKIVAEIRSALSQPVPLLLVTGAAGSGKTMVCRMVEKELPEGMISVFLPKAINSFDDMVAILLEQIGPELDADSMPAGTAGLVIKIADLLRGRNLRLVVFFDEAEKIFLATLERVRKLLDQVNEEQIVFQFVFSGDESFEDNLKQLSMVRFKDIEELHFKLKPLDEQESCHYLNHCVKIASGVDETVFSQDLVSKVSRNGASFRRLNLFALESIQSDRLDTSFLGLLDTDEGNDVIKPRREMDQWTLSKSPQAKEPNLEFLSLKKLLPGWILYGAGTTVIIVLLFFWFGRTGEGEQDENAIADVPIIELKRVVPENLPSDQQETVEALQETASVPQLAAEVVREPAKAENEQAAEEQPPGQAESDGPEPVADEKVADAQPPAEIRKEPPEEKTTPGPATIKETAVTDAGDREVLNERTEGFEKVVDNKAEDTTNVMVEPLEQTEKPFSPDVIKETKPPDIPREKEPVVIIDEEKKFRESQESGDKTVAEDIPEGTLSNLSDKEVNALFLTRIAAGARWLVGGGSGKYTIQLMVLTSTQAEKSLKQMLRTVEYQSVADQLYVLRRTGPDPTVMVFYGEYANLAAARNARNNLPVFLRKHNPYAISVFGAVEKATTPQ